MRLQNTPLILIGPSWPALIEWARQAMLAFDPPLADAENLAIPRCLAVADGARAIIQAHTTPRGSAISRQAVPDEESTKGFHPAVGRASGLGGRCAREAIGRRRQRPPPALTGTARVRWMGYFTDALQSDVSDIQQGTAAEGIHAGAMAGTVDLVQRALTDIEVSGDVLRLNPRLPEEVERLDMRIRYRGHSLDLRVTRDTLTVRGRDRGAAPIELAVRGETCEFAGDGTQMFRLGSVAQWSVGCGSYTHGAPGGACGRADTITVAPRPAHAEALDLRVWRHMTSTAPERPARMLP